ncbi:MAG: recombination-associated protein RdgC [Gammaproteobacteria bacterium]|jgi:recombination associated protein RdgC|nr:recombination-associated protein RdgC [Gammaproteobacteria bacterium]MBT3858527.1 recombination-associated protein RdgC [Gammaproteobacteria bacterium]MBT3986735.1 recombination-associated protein RdgC [Gammaproteobacteria bacterium]MBT4255647.1 recombination-associated protein RdgC [Gammaproteobacteria bacterium]MBT4582831.1 recombination-associated protein RdgC [Gammaproteobacteria bacterium]
MWFKNVRLYCFTKPFEISPEDIEKKLLAEQFSPCSSYEKSSSGWVSPLGKEGEMLTHIVGDFLMVCLQKQERILPASVIRDATEEKVAELEERQARKIHRKEKRQIQDDVFVTLLPKAFTRNQQTYAYIAPKDNLIVIDAASAPKAEELLKNLRDSIGSLPVALPDTRRAPSDVMTRWLKEQNASDNFEIEDDCEFYNPLDGGNVIRCKGQDLYCDEIQSHLDAGKQVKNLGVSWKSLLSCNIGSDLSIKRLKFEVVKEEQDSFEEETPAQKFDQEFALMTLELSSFFKSFFNAFGGLEDLKELDQE